MARALLRLSTDWVDAWGHPVFLVETFVDPSRHIGTCYCASSFLYLGKTAGYGRRSGRYFEHHQIKDVYVRELHRKSRQVLSGAFDHPLLATDPRRSMALIDFNTADLTSLIERIEAITDPRDPRGVRHSFASTLVLIACATLAGHKSLVALSEWSDVASQEVLSRLNARVSPHSGLRVPPSYATIRRAAMSVDPDEFDLIINTWSAQQSDRRQKGRKRDDTEDSDRDRDSDGVRAELVGVAVDGKTVRGARRPDGTQVQLLSALRHDTGMVIAQRNVENDKTNEILAFAPLLKPLNLTGTVITADAMHTQRKGAKFVVGKGGHYIFGVNGNQPRLYNAALEAAKGIDFDHPEHESCQRGHGRIDRNRVWSAPVPSEITFPYARRCIIVERESFTLNGIRTSVEARYYVTDLAADDASIEQLFRLVHGHWSIENSLH